MRQSPMTSGQSARRSTMSRPCCQACASSPALNCPAATAASASSTSFQVGTPSALIHRSRWTARQPRGLRRPPPSASASRPARSRPGCGSAGARRRRGEPLPRRCRSPSPQPLVPVPRGSTSVSRGAATGRHRPESPAVSRRTALRSVLRRTGACPRRARSAHGRGRTAQTSVMRASATPRAPRRQRQPCAVAYRTWT